MDAYTVESLKNAVLKAERIFLNQVDALAYDDYKPEHMAYMLLFFTMKKMSDEFEEEAKIIMQETNDKEKAWSDPKGHKIFLPEDARFDHFGKICDLVFRKSKTTLADIDKYNKNMDGLFKYIYTTYFENLKSNEYLETAVTQLLAHFNGIGSLGAGNLKTPFVAAEVFEYLLAEHFSSSKQIPAGFYIPSSVSKLMVSLLDLKEDMSVCDPTCNTGNLLTECERYTKGQNEGANISIYGQEINQIAWSICKLNMIQHNRPDAVIKNGNIISDPKLLDNKDLMKFDRVISTPPFGICNWGHELAGRDPYRRFRYGIPPKMKGDFAYLEHMISTLNDDGKLVTIIPPGMLFRGGSEGRIRQNIVESGIVDAVISLPPKLLYGTSIPVCILIINMNKPEERSDSILFISAEQECQSKRAQNILRKDDINKIIRAYEEYEDVDKYARVVNLSEIEKNEYDLNISRYVDSVPAIETVDVEAVLREIGGLEMRRMEARNNMDECLKGLGYNN